MVLLETLCSDSKTWSFWWVGMLPLWVWPAGESLDSKEKPFYSISWLSGELVLFDRENIRKPLSIFCIRENMVCRNFVVSEKSSKIDFMFILVFHRLQTAKGINRKIQIRALFFLIFIYVLSGKNLLAQHIWLWLDACFGLGSSSQCGSFLLGQTAGSFQGATANSVYTSSQPWVTGHCFIQLK